MLRQVKAAKRERIVAHGSVESHSCPSWLTYDHAAKRYVLNERAPGFRRIFELAAAHVSLYRIARQLVAEGYRPTRGKVWQSSTISKVVRSDAAIGVFRPVRMANGKEIRTGEVVPNYYPLLVSADLFKHASDAKRERTQATGNKGKHFTNLFTRFGFCAECGAPMQLQPVKKPKKVTHYLVCSTKRAQLGCKTPRNFRYDTIEEVILRNVRELDLSKLMADDVADQRVNRLSAEIADADRRILDLGEVMENLMDKIERAHKDVASALEARLVKRQAEFVAAKADLSKLKAERDKSERERKARVAGPEQVERFLAALKKADDSQRYTVRSNLAGVLRSFIDQIIMDGETRDVQVILFGGRKRYRFNADDAQAVWTELVLKLPDVSAGEARAFLTEIEGTAKTITADRSGTTVIFDGDNEAEAVMMKLALFKHPLHRPGGA